MDKSLLLRVLSPGEEPAPFYCFLQIQQQANALPPHQQTQFAAWTAAALASASRKGVGGDVFLALKCARAYKTLLKLSLPGLKQLLLQGGAEPLRALLNLRSVRALRERLLLLSASASLSGTARFFSSFLCFVADCPPIPCRATRRAPP